MSNLELYAHALLLLALVAPSANSLIRRLVCTPKIVLLNSILVTNVAIYAAYLQDFPLAGAPFNSYLQTAIVLSALAFWWGSLMIWSMLPRTTPRASAGLTNLHKERHTFWF